MILEKGNMWDVFGNTDLFLITTNPIRRKDGALVMGRGIALEAAKKFPHLPYVFGKQVAYDERYQDYTDALYPSSCNVVGKFGDQNQKMGYFMVKRHWRLPADLNVIAISTKQLARLAPLVDRIDLNFPGIGNGRIGRDQVLPIIEGLPDNVHVWEYG